MSDELSVAVTGGGGRLGSALLDVLGAQSVAVVSVGRSKFDLDDPEASSRLVSTTDFELIIHCAAWTDVDACAREPALAQRRNGDAAGKLAEACASAGRRMVLVSTNEVFDGNRSDGRGYAETDEARPGNAYGASKLSAEEQCRKAFGQAGREHDMLVVRTAWLFGRPGADFPARVIAAADQLRPGEALPVVADETGSPTSAADLADAIVSLALERRASGVVHVVNDGRASRLAYAQRVLDRCRPPRETMAIRRPEFARASTPPAWAVLDTGRARGLGIALRPWQEALDDYLERACPS